MRKKQKGLRKLEKKKGKFFEVLSVIACVMINGAFILENWEYSYILFWLAVAMLLVGIIGSLFNGSVKKIFDILEKIL